MATHTVQHGTGVDWRRAEFVLTALGILGFITLPIRITTIYAGSNENQHNIMAKMVLGL